MEKIIGLGGLFIKANDPKALCAWYDEHLGTNFNGSTSLTLKSGDTVVSEEPAVTVFSFFKSSSDYFQPSTKECMLNLRVRNLDAMLQQLRTAGVWVDEKTEAHEYGKFGWCMDPEGNKIELWEPGELKF
jgi:predicted enzyme related to lactoylglutathione lyase